MRLIDADELKKSAYMESGAASIAEMVVTVRDIDDAPTVDAIPDIRCRECRFYSEPTDLYPHHTCENPDGLVHPWPTAYCSYAKRYSVDEEEEEE